MLSCLNGALELYRTTGDRKLLDLCRIAWQDIVAHRPHVTGAASYCEYFHDDFDLPNYNKVGETCVTVTWLQFNAQLLRLTGEARFAEQLRTRRAESIVGGAEARWHGVGLLRADGRQEALQIGVGRALLSFQRAARHRVGPAQRRLAAPPARESKAREARLGLDELRHADAIFVGNGLRGLVQVRLVESKTGIQ